MHGLVWYGSGRNGGELLVGVKNVLRRMILTFLSSVWCVCIICRYSCPLRSLFPIQTFRRTKLRGCFCLTFYAYQLSKLCQIQPQMFLPYGSVWSDSWIDITLISYLDWYSFLDDFELKCQNRDVLKCWNFQLFNPKYFLEAILPPIWWILARRSLCYQSV